MTPTQHAAYLRILTNLLGCLYCENSEMIWNYKAEDEEEKVWNAADCIRQILGLSADEYNGFMEKGAAKVCVTHTSDGLKFCNREDGNPITVSDVISNIPTVT